MSALAARGPPFECLYSQKNLKRPLNLFRRETANFMGRLASMARFRGGAILHMFCYGVWVGTILSVITLLVAARIVRSSR